MRAPAQANGFSVSYSVQYKYAFVYLVMIAAVLVLMNTYPILISQQMVFKSKKSSLQSQASVIASALAGSDALTEDSVGRVMDVLGDTELSRILVTDPTGMVLYDTEKSSPTVGRYALLRELTSALALWSHDAFTSDYYAGAFYSRAAVPVTYRGMTLGAVYVTEYDTEQGQLIMSIQQTLKNIALSIIAVALTTCVVLSRIMTRRTAQLLEGIRHVREGEYNHRVTVKGHDELSQMACEFNALTDRLQSTEEVRRRFVSDASHELKTPLASIRLLADSILQADNIDLATVQEFVGDIGSEAERLTRITEHLLALTRLDASNDVEAEAVDVTEVIGRVKHMLSPLAQANSVELHVDLVLDQPVRCTEDDLYQILFNLIENAIKYNLPGGHVWISTRQQNDWGVLSVEDTGVGIPEEDMPKIFDRFYRVDKARSRAAGGTGLGLSIVQDTIRHHGGAVKVQCREPKGVRFTVTLPLWREEVGS